MQEVGIQHNPRRDTISIQSWTHTPNGHIHFATMLESGQPPTIYDHDPMSGQQAAREPVEYVLTTGQARELMEELQRHFGAYAGVDYQRLRDDFDKVRDELTKANNFIQDMTKTIIEGRKSASPKAPEPAAQPVQQVVVTPQQVWHSGINNVNRNITDPWQLSQELTDIKNRIMIKADIGHTH